MMKLYELIESGAAFQCKECGEYFTKELTAQKYFGGVEADGICAACYSKEYKTGKGI